MPPHAQFTCDGCSKNVMGLYYSSLGSAGGANGTAGLGLGGKDLDNFKSDYADAQELAARGCGGTFAVALSGARDLNLGRSGKVWLGVVAGLVVRLLMW
jgi:hypothetical protein